MEIEKDQTVGESKDLPNRSEWTTAKSLLGKAASSINPSGFMRGILVIGILCSLERDQQLLADLMLRQQRDAGSASSS